MPIKSKNVWTSLTFVIMSARLSKVTIFSINTSQMKCTLIFMCFVLSWYIWFLVNWMTLWLSQCTIISFWFTPRSPRPLSHKASLTTSVAATYSTSVVYKVTVDCKVALQPIALYLQLWKYNQSKDLLQSRSLA